MALARCRPTQAASTRFRSAAAATAGTAAPSTSAPPPAASLASLLGVDLAQHDQAPLLVVEQVVEARSRVAVGGQVERAGHAVEVDVLAGRERLHGGRELREVVP